MARWQFLNVLLGSIALFVTTNTQSQSDELPVGWGTINYPPQWRAQSAEDTDNTVCKTYSLKAVGDAQFGSWVVETIPQIVMPGSWTNVDIKNQFSTKTVSHVRPTGKIFYFAPKQVLVIQHCPQAQKQVEMFLSTVVKAAAQKRRAPVFPGSGVQQTQFATPNLMTIPASANQPSSNSMSTTMAPAPNPRPKHLFHFIIRYEGEGIIDSNVVEFNKVMNGQSRTMDPVLSRGRACCQSGQRPMIVPSAPTVLPEAGYAVPSNVYTPSSTLPGNVPAAPTQYEVPVDDTQPEPKNVTPDANAVPAVSY